MPDLIVLCHSLGRGEAEALADKIRVCCPKTRVLLVVSQGSEEKQYQDAKFDAMILPEPIKLINKQPSCLRDLLTTMRERMDATGGCL
jgi:hypothetical protein